MVFRKGFTLIEILVVITIIGVMAGVIGASYVPTRQRARDGKRKADLELLRSGLEMYRVDIGSYPAYSQVLVSAIADLDDYVTIPSDPSDAAYYYTKGSGDTYFLCACLEDDDDLSNFGFCGSCGGNCGTQCNYQIKNP